MKHYNVIKNTSDKEIQVLVVSDRSIITNTSAFIAFIPNGDTKAFIGQVSDAEMTMTVPAGAEVHVFMLDQLQGNYKEPRDVVELKGYYSGYSCHEYLSLNPDLGEQSYCLALTRSENSEALVSVIGMNRYTEEVQIDQIDLNKDNVLDVLVLNKVTNVFIIRHTHSLVCLKAKCIEATSN